MVPCGPGKFEDNLIHIFHDFEFMCKTPTVGFEPTTFGLEVQRASPLRHAGLFHSVKNHEVMK